MPSEYSGSSIPIPDGVAVWTVLDWGAGDEDGPVYLEGDIPDPVVDDRLIRVADLPKLYAHWAEGRVEAVAKALHDEVPRRAFCPFENRPEVVKADWRRKARAALGPGERT